MLVAVGVVLRAVEFLAAKSLWRDESMLVFNLAHRDPFGFLQPLDSDQAVQPGFFVLEDLLGSAFGESVYAYRLVPFLAGCASLPLAMFLARRHLPPVAGIVTIGLVVFGGGLVYFSAEAKPYSVDVLVTLVLLLATSRTWEHRFDRRSVRVWAIVGAVSLAFSFAVSFVLGSVGIIAFVTVLLSRDRQAMWRVIGVGLTWAAAWVVMFGAVGRYAVGMKETRRTMRDGFLPIPPLDAGGWHRWNVSIRSYFVQLGPSGSEYVLGALLIVGIAVLWFRNRTLLAMLVLPWVLAVIASSRQLYPAAERVMLFILPMLSALVGFGADWLTHRLAPRAAAAKYLVPGLVLALVAPSAAWRALDPPVVEELGPVLEDVRDEIRPDDTVYVTPLAQAGFDYFDRQLDVPGHTVLGTASEDDPAAVRDDITRQGLRGRVWVITSAYFSPPEEMAPGVVHAFSERGRRIETRHQTGASAFLYELPAN